MSPRGPSGRLPDGASSMTPLGARMVVALSVALGLTSLAVASPASATTTLTSCQFSAAQVFDVQWYIDGGSLYVSGLTRPYSSVEPYPGGPLAESDIDAGDYFMFYEDAGNVGFRMFRSDDTLKHTLHTTGSFAAYGEDFLFYNGDGSWGTVITTSDAFAYGDSAVLAVTVGGDTSPSAMLGYSDCSATPLAVVPGGSSGGTPGGSPRPSAPMLLPDGVPPRVTGANATLGSTRGTTPLTVELSPQSLTVRDGEGTLEITVSGDRGASGSLGVTADVNGAITCRICADLAAGSVVEAWMFSDERLVAALRVEESEDGSCPFLRIPLSGPLDGGGPLPAGQHTLQLLLPTVDGIVAVNIGTTLTAGDGLRPNRIGAGEGATSLTAFASTPLLITVLGAALLVGRASSRRRIATR